ncbi:hypothetical protein ACMA1D_10810 [Streptomyces sp. 796.1]|uniref:hypothetical protein n=1 Tax=Streptomyces sp. 796.1 TaxID=3163029 RepID=UPI0039C9099C
MSAPTYDIASEQVPAAADNAPAAAHALCRVCYPRGTWPLVAICGEPLLGIPCPPGTPRCEHCTHITPHHVRGHLS